MSFVCRSERRMLRSSVLFCIVATSMGFMLPSSMTPLQRSRAVAPSMNFFDDMKKGLTKLQAGSYDEAAVKAKVEQQIRTKPCVMYSLSTCPFCAKAKSALTAMGAMYSVVELDDEDDGMAMKAELAGITGQTSCPQVFIGGKFIGGCNDGGMGGSEGAGGLIGVGPVGGGLVK